MLTKDQIEAYGTDGYLLVENVLSARELATLRQVTDDLVAASHAVTEHNHIYDLEPTHTREAPRVRRIKEPHNVHPAFREIAFGKKIAEILTPLIGIPSGIRYQTGKLNMKAAGYGAAVEWHQDWAFYPHTNDDLLAIGIYFDDCGPDNGPLMVIPGSHRWPISDHHSGGVFCGAIDPTTAGIDFSKAVMLTGKAGSMTIHHVRMVHGSALNTSGRPRRLLLFQYTAVDAFPLLGIPDWEKFNANIVTGEPTMEPRLTPVPVRIPLPVAPFEGSIYENQRSLGNRYFEVYEEAQKAVRAI
jgi:ectoine hydroxylase-related dioxygenase (phytanoyl-CoA dioxygenase family)